MWSLPSLPSLLSTWHVPEGSLVALFFSFLGYTLLTIFARKTEQTHTRPPLLPYTFPFVRSTVHFGFYGLDFFSKFSKTIKRYGTAGVSLLDDDIYLVQGAENISEIFRNPNLTMTKAYGIALKHCFGMKQKAADTYFNDTSGARLKPIPGSNVPITSRIGLPTHENLSHGLLGPGLDQVTIRFAREFQTQLQSCQITEDWSHFPDLVRFVENLVGGAVLRAMFGPLLLEQGDFLRDLFVYDRSVMDLARRLPVFLAPSAHRAKAKVLKGIKQWHRAAAAQYDPDYVSPFDDGFEPAWGCAMMRDRQRMLLNIDNQDQDAVASADLALIWASVTNVVPSSVTLALNVFQDAESLAEIRSNIKDMTPSLPADLSYVRRLERQPLLQSFYAETLRFGVQIHIPRTAPHHTVVVSKRHIPQNHLILVSTWAAHNDADVWNTKQGAQPLDGFWGRRFLVDPHDPHSGPHRRNARPGACNGTSKGEPQFSLEGLEGSWIPYGGGHHACPGRLLAKRIMMLFLATLANEFDIEPLVDIRYGSSRFGFGVRKPVGEIPFRIRRRR